MASPPHRWQIAAGAVGVYLTAVAVAFTADVPTALCVTPVFIGALAWAFGPTVGLLAAAASEAVAFLALSRAYPPAAGLSPAALMAGVLASDLCILCGAVALRRSEGRRDRAEAELRDKNAALESSLAEVKELRGLLPLCAWCKCVRDVDGMWSRLEAYLARHSRATLTHGICPACAARVRAEIDGPPAG